MVVGKYCHRGLPISTLYRLIFDLNGAPLAINNNYL